MPPLNSEHARWFAQEVYPHEPKLRSWLKLRFPGLGDVDDLVQETYVRLFRSAKVGNLDHPQSYLYAVARNAALDQLRHNRVAKLQSLEDTAPKAVLEEAPDAAAQLNHEQEIKLLCDAIEALPTRCRLVVKLRKLRGLSYQEIAAELGISVHTVNAQLAVGLAKCRDYLREKGVE